MNRRWIEEALDVANRKISELEKLTEKEFRQAHDVREDMDTFPNLTGDAIGALQVIKTFILWGLKDECREGNSEAENRVSG